jgi:hypothetical protein
MRIFIKSLIALMILILLLYSASWYFVLYGISSKINEHAGQSLNLEKITKNLYFIKFSKSSPAGFPFKLAIKISDFEEEGVSSKTEYKNPIYIGYDLLKQRFFMNHQGDVLALYKPLQSKFGSRINSSNLNIYINFPISLKLIKFVFAKKKHGFELVNFIRNLEFDCGKLQVFDLVDDEKLYDQEYSRLIIDIVRHKDYLNFEDFLNDIPKQANILSESKVNHAADIAKKISPSNLLYNIYLPFACTQKQQLYIKTESKTLDELKNNIEIGLTSFLTSNKIKDFNGNLLYRGFVDSSVNKFSINLKSEFELKEGIVDDVFYALQIVADVGMTPSVAMLLKGDLDYILNNKDKFTLKKLEDKKYNLNLDLALTRSSSSVEIDVNDFEIFTDNTGFKLKGMHEITNPSIFMDNAKAKLEGDLVLYDYDNLVSFILDNIFVLNKYTGFEESEGKFRKTVLLDFLKTISDHPTSTSKDISFEYNIDLQNIETSKLGAITLDKLSRLYNITLYKKIAQKISASDDFDAKINELAPSLTKEEKDFLRQLIVKPQGIDNNLWNNLIEH